jgi:dihydrofolate reductase
MKAIVCVNKKWSIGKNGDLLYSLSGDMKFFRETTKGKTVVMGRKTLDSFSEGKPLKNRVNIVISKNIDVSRDVIWVNSPSDALSKITDSENTFLIGGSSIYEQLIDFCDEALVTIVEDDTEGDSFFPNLLERKNWALVDESEEFSENGLKYRFCKFMNNVPKEF